MMTWTETLTADEAMEFVKGLIDQGVYEITIKRAGLGFRIIWSWV